MGSCRICGKRHPNPSYNPCYEKERERVITLRENKIKELEEQVRSLSNESLRYYNELLILRTVTNKIEKYACHAGCNGNPDCPFCPINKILKEINKIE